MYICDECVSGTRLGRQSNSVKLSTLMEYQTDVQTQHGESLPRNKDRETIYLPDDSMCDYDNSFSDSEHNKEQSSDSPPVSRTDSTSLGVSTVTAEKYKFDDFREVAVFNRSCSLANFSDRFSSLRRKIELDMSDDQNLSFKPDSSRRFVQNQDSVFRRKESRCSSASRLSASLSTADVDGSLSLSQHEYDSPSKQQSHTLSKCRLSGQDKLSAPDALNERCMTVTSKSDQKQHSIPSASASGSQVRFGGLLPSGRPDATVLYSRSSDYRCEVSDNLSDMTGNKNADVDHGVFQAASAASNNRFPTQELLETKGVFFDTANIRNMMNTEETGTCIRGIDVRRSAHHYEDHQALFDYLSDAFKMMEEMIIRVSTFSPLWSYFIT
jgi:hypothetical protein